MLRSWRGEGRQKSEVRSEKCPLTRALRVHPLPWARALKLWEGPPARFKIPDCRFKERRKAKGERQRAWGSAAAVLRAFQPPVALPGANLPPSGDFFLKRQLQQVLERFALPVFDVGAPGAGQRFTPGSLRGPVALPPLPVFLCPPCALKNNPPAARQRPGAFGHVRVLGQGAARPRSVEGLAPAGGGDPGSANGLGRLLRKRAYKGQQGNQPGCDGKRCPNDAPPERSVGGSSSARRG
jgi:hypothetical protein